MSAKGFSKVVLGALRTSKILRIRAGSGPHRVIGIWMVMVESRVFVRSWTVEKNGWFDTFLKEKRGIIEIGKRRIRVRGIHTKSDRLKNAVTEAYAEKYHTPGAKVYVEGFRSRKRKDATMELVPA